MNKESVIHDFIEHCMMIEGKNIDSYIWDLNDVRNEVKKYLSQQKPRTKTEFVKCEFDSDIEMAKAFIGEELFYYTHGKVKQKFEDNLIKVNSIADLVSGSGIYRKAETEIDERQEFIDVIEEHCHENGFGVNRMFLGSLYDSGKFKLVE